MREPHGSNRPSTSCESSCEFPVSFVTNEAIAVSVYRAAGAFEQVSRIFGLSPAAELRRGWRHALSERRACGKHH